MSLIPPSIPPQAQTKSTTSPIPIVTPLTNTPLEAIPVVASNGLNSRRQTRRPSRFSNNSTHGIVVRALHKTASMFLYRFFEQVSFDCKLDYYSVNHDHPTEHFVDRNMESSFCVCPVRDFSSSRFASFNHLDRVTQIFHVRDPRDIIVSEYFSFGWIHPEKHFSHQERMRRAHLQAMTVDEYAINQPNLIPSLAKLRYEPLLSWLDRNDSNCNIVLVKYETMVTNFPAWASAVIQPFSFRWPRVAVARYHWKYRNEFKTKGETMTHKRRITPGDHRAKLKPSTIEILNERFEPILTRLGYEF